MSYNVLHRSHQKYTFSTGRGSNGNLKDYFFGNRLLPSDSMPSLARTLQKNNP